MSETKLPDDFWTAEVSVDPLAQDPDVGADLTKIEAYTEELESIVQPMWEDMTTETKVLEGTEIPEREEIVIPRITEEEFLAWLKTNVSSTEESPSTE
jgi:hypothetical protein